MEVFRPPFTRPWLPSGGPDIDQFGRADLDELIDRNSSFAWFLRAAAKTFMTSRDQIQNALEADMPDWLADLGSSSLHHGTHEVEGNDAHPQSLASHLWILDVESLHAQRGLQITEFYFNVPTLMIEIGHVLRAMCFVIQKARHQNHA